MHERTDSKNTHTLYGIGATFDFYDAVMIDATVLMGLDVVARRVIGSSIWLINDSTVIGTRGAMHLLLTCR